MKQFNQHSGLTAEQRFWTRVEKTDSCWLWMGNLNNGYGTFMVNAKLVRAHAYSFSLVHGAIPKGMVLCHRCDTPKCVNPAHLFLGTQAENLKDMYSKGRSAKQQLTHCLNGHEFTEENTYRRPGAPQTRQCLICRAERYQRTKPAPKSRPTHCLNGHEYPLGVVDKNNWRRCAECLKVNQKAYKAKKRAKCQPPKN